MLMNSTMSMYSELIINYILTLSSILLMMNLLIKKTNHPVELMVYLVLFSIIMCLKTSLLNKNFWFSYLLFLTMIGGILILFLYFVSTASNETNTNIKYNMNFSMIMSMFIIIIMMLITKYYDIMSMNLFESITNQTVNLSNSNWSNINNYNMNKMFNNNYKITLMIMIYLLFTLFTVMKMCMKMYGPLRQYL